MVTLNLPTAPPELRSIAPYLQRANELKDQEPVMAYWCTSLVRVFRDLGLMRHLCRHILCRAAGYSNQNERPCRTQLLVRVVGSSGEYEERDRAG